jgi:NTE family protein
MVIGKTKELQERMSPIRVLGAFSKAWTFMSDPSTTVAMVFSGGLGMAAYHAGVYQAFSEQELPLHWVAGSLAGAVTAALIAGNRRDDRIERLQEFWNFPPIQDFSAGSWRHLYGCACGPNQADGKPRAFPPQHSINATGFRSVYDLAPMREKMARLIGFGRLNSGESIVCIAATDIETGEPVIFDSRKLPIEIDHLLASCGFLSEFAPVELGGRLLRDGGLSLNAPFDPIMKADIRGDLLMYVVDLYARDGERPRSFEAAAERKNDLLFGNQTAIRLEYCFELRRLRRKLECSGGDDRIVLLSYRPEMESRVLKNHLNCQPQHWRNAG